MRLKLYFMILLVPLPFLSALPRENFFDPPVLLTKEQKEKLDKFKTAVLPLVPKKSHLSDFCRDDLYLVKWLQAWSWNVPNSIKMFADNVRWRREEGIEGIASEDWSFFQSEYEAFADGIDKKGRPVAEMTVSSWDVRRAVLAGRQKRLIRWMTRLFEVQERRLYRARREGVNITQAVLLVDISNFNPMTHACPGCVQIYEQFGWNWENHYPNIYDKLYILNSNPSFQLVLTIIRPFLKEEAERIIQAHPMERTWKPALDKVIDKSQRGSRYGGTRDRE